MGMPIFVVADKLRKFKEAFSCGVLPAGSQFPNELTIR